MDETGNYIHRQLLNTIPYNDSDDKMEDFDDDNGYDTDSDATELWPGEEEEEENMPSPPPTPPPQ